MKNDLIIDHINKKLLSTELETDPWVYKFIDNIFPEEFYTEIINALPSNNFYKSRTEIGQKAKTTNYNKERFVFILNAANLKTLSKAQNIFWSSFSRIIFDDSILKNVLDIFKETIEQRMKNLSEVEKKKLGLKNYRIYKKAEIVKDFKKYHLGAHTDNFNKFITFLFYLPKDKSLENLGTSIYKKKIEIPVNEVAKHQSKEETESNFTKIKTCKFHPNSLLIFPRTNDSFHGVDEINIEAKERDLLLLNYYIYGVK